MPETTFCMDRPARRTLACVGLIRPLRGAEERRLEPPLPHVIDCFAAARIRRAVFAGRPCRRN